LRHVVLLVFVLLSMVFFCVHQSMDYNQ